jgi:hypothetical protein
MTVPNGSLYQEPSDGQQTDDNITNDNDNSDVWELNLE